MVAMLAGNDTLASGLVEPMGDYLTERGLGGSALARTLRSALERPTVDAAQFCELLESLYRLDPAPALGLRLGLAAKPRHFGMLGYLVLSCGNLGQAMTRYRRFQTLLQTGLESRVENHDGVLRIRWTQRAARTALAYEYSVGCFVGLYQSVIGRPIAPLAAGLPSPHPGDAAMHEVLLGCPVQFDADTLFVDLPARLMAMPISSRDPHLRRLLEAQAGALVEQPGNADADQAAFFEKLQGEIVSALKDGDASAERVAEFMGYSRRSFYRRLAAGGYSYRAVLADIRLRLAKQYLADESLSPSQVAPLLGYSEQSSFIRAFRGWIGITPGAYRARLNKRR